MSDRLSHPPKGWRAAELGSVADLRFSNVDKKTREGQKPVRLCNYMDVWKNNYIRADMPFMVSTASDREMETFGLRVHDVLITKDSETKEEIAQPSVVLEVNGSPPMVLGYHLAMLRPDPEHVYGPFLSAQLSVAKFRSQFVRQANGTTRFGLGVDTINEAVVWLPPLPEQKRIAAVLSAVDGAIESNRAVQTQTRRLKQATLQSLLTHGLPGKKSKLTIHRLGDLYTERREPGARGMRTVSVTIDSGLVDRDEMERRVESELTPEQHLRVHVGDLAYNTMRMWQGCSGVAGVDCLVSPAYVVCAPTDMIDPLFGGYLLRWENTIHKLHMQSQGVADDRLRLYFEQFARIKVSVPPVADQRRIASCLSAIDTRLSSTTAALSALTKLKAALSQELLTGSGPTTREPSGRRRA